MSGVVYDRKWSGVGSSVGSDVDKAGDGKTDMTKSGDNYAGNDNQLMCLGLSKSILLFCRCVGSGFHSLLLLLYSTESIDFSNKS